ncbi:retrovirus-related Pol polyprotein from transposon TNT 1-94 isoform X2 [Coffea arabica]|uniref:Retrovirus-related Pol polyprotein from transposon TNT 1-94 isoform X2 n=1 Tax=Coffea arabica TaxID=13443 RepID=A0ABM4VFS8_COFAR
MTHGLLTPGLLIICQDLKTKRTIGGGYEHNGLYFLNFNGPIACPATVSPLEIHCRLGHPSLQNLKKLVPTLSQLSSLECESCQLGKHHRVSFAPRVNKRVSEPFLLVHSDVWGPSRVTSKLGFKYFVIFVDDFSRVTWFYLMKDRSELYSIFCAFVAEIKNQFGVPVRILRSDNAKEYFSTPFNTFMSKSGIIHQSSCPHTPQQNGVAERKIGHLIEIARTVLLHMNVPKQFWSDAVLTACYLINRMPSNILGGQLPHSILFPHEPVFKLPPRIFGCVCFVHQLTPGVDKLDSRAIKCIFLGYARAQKGYRCYSPVLNRFFTCADVTFFESTPYFIKQSMPCELDQCPSFSSPVLPVPSPLLPESSSPPDSIARLSRPHLQVYSRRSIVEKVPDMPRTSPINSQSSNSGMTPSCELDLPIALRKGKRHCTSHPISNFVSYSRFSMSYSSFVASLDSISIPKSITYALNHPGWRLAMQEEMPALEQNGTWDLVPRPSGGSNSGLWRSENCRW